MGKIIPIHLTAYYPYHKGLSKSQKQIEGGVTDTAGKPLNTLEDFIEGKADYVSLARDHTGGAPGNAGEFKIYGYKVSIPALDVQFNNGCPIEFRLVDTGGHFYTDEKKGTKKVIVAAGREPIDVCVREKPPANFFNNENVMLTLVGKS